MTIEDLTKDLTLYQGGALAGRLLKSKEGQAYLPGALEQLAYDVGMKEPAMGFFKAAMASEDGIKFATATYYKNYEDALGELTIKDLYGIHKGDLEKGLSDKEKAVFKEKYVSDGTNIKEVKAKIAKLQHQEASPDAEESKKAKKELEKYSNIVELFEMTQDILYKNLLPNAIEKTNMMKAKALAQS